MINTVNTDKYLNELKEEFSFYSDKRELLEAMVEKGKELPKMPEELLIKENKVPGCVSGVYIKISKENNGKYYFIGHSESMIVRGYVKVLFDLLEGKTKEEILASEEKINSFVDETGLAESMLTSRASAFGNIIRFIKEKL